jgi:hypothetical protein
MRAHALREMVLLPAELYMAAGTCYAVFAYDVGLSIALEECERRITALTQRATIRHKHRAPDYFEYRPAPLRVSQDVEPLLVGGYRTHTSVDTVLYDFGAVSITYRIPLQGAFSTLLALGDDLYDNALLLQDSRQRIAQLLEIIASAVVRPHTSDFVEDYAIFQVEAFTVPCQAEALCAQYAQEIAQLLRLERQTLSQQEVSDALSHRISFSPDDVTIIDWNAAFLLARDAEDVLAVLEFANVELLEMRYLDEQLDNDLDQSYDALSRYNWGRFRLRRSPHADLRRIAQMQVDSAVLFEGVNNALKLLGDQYLARVYRLASQRFHLEEWDASILRKLHILESIYNKISDQAATWRLELLEWIVILLIAVSIMLPFVFNLPGH